MCLLSDAATWPLHPGQLGKGSTLVALGFDSV